MTTLLLSVLSVIAAPDSGLPPTGIASFHPSPTHAAMAVGVAGSASYGWVRHARIAVVGFPEPEGWLRAGLGDGQFEIRLTQSMLHAGYRIELSAPDASWRWALLPSLGIGADHARAASDKATTRVSVAPGLAALWLWREGVVYAGTRVSYVWQGEHIVYEGGAADTFRSGGFIHVGVALGSVFASGERLSYSAEIAAIYARSRGRPDVTEALTIMPSVALRL